jgi:hypothetical protein
MCSKSNCSKFNSEHNQKDLFKHLVKRKQYKHTHVNNDQDTHTSLENYEANGLLMRTL